LIAGYILDINNAFKFKPALLTKMVKGSCNEVDLSGNFMFNENSSLGLLIGGVLQLPQWLDFKFQMLYVGYAYDLNTD
jgi:hypothetical protein